MSLPFIILGLPRSRTAWLANFLTFGEISCGHEMMSQFSIHGLFDELTGSNLRYCGDADTAASMFLPDILRYMPDIPIVVVRRETKDVLTGLRKMGMSITEHQLRPMMDGLCEAVKLENTLAVKFEDLDSESTLRAVQSHCAPGEPFDRQRASMLRDLNIQITPARWSLLFEKARKHCVLA